MIKAALFAFIVILAALVVGCKQQEFSNPIALNPGGDAQDNAEESDNGDVIDIAIKDFAFSPAEIRIKKGIAIRWKNYDSAPHDVTSTIGKELASATLQNNDEYQHAFNEIGTFEYYCSIHPRMKAKVIVENP